MHVSKQLRRWSSWVPGVIVTLALLATSLLAASGERELSTTVDENWRGSYDILVSAPGQDFGTGATAGYADPNFVASSMGKGISLDELRKVREITDVEVAAPIGMVGVLRQNAYTPYLALADDPASKKSDLNSPVELLRITSSLVDESPQGASTLSSSAGLSVVRARTGTQDAQELITPASSSDFAATATDTTILVGLGAVPTLSTNVIAVDPEAEATLRGDDASTFLKPFGSLPSGRDLRTTGGWSSLVPAGHYDVQQSVALGYETGDEPDKAHIAVPLLVNAGATHPLKLKVKVEAASVDQDRDVEAAGALDEIASSARFATVLDTDADASKLALPFTSSVLSLALPGSTVDPAQGVLYLPPAQLSTGVITRPDYRPGDATTSQTQNYSVSPLGQVFVDGDTTGSLPESGTTLEPTTSYRSIKNHAGPGLTSAVPVPLGTFTPQELHDTDAESAGYTPSGIAGTTQAELTRLPDGTSTSTPVLPQLNGVDFLTSAPGAITDLAGGEQLRGNAPIDAIRVRVSGITSYTTEAQERVAAVAQAIEDLGLQARIVAGSSLSKTDVYVRGYWHRAGTTSDLGWVSQEWTNLGAAATVTDGFSGSNAALAISALLVVGLLTLVLYITTGIGRRREVTVLATLGWRRGTTRVSLLRRDLPGLVLVVLTASALWWWQGEAVLLPALLLLATLALGMSLALFIATGRASAATHTHRSRPGSLSAWTLSRRPLLVHPWRSLIEPTIAVLLAIVAATGCRAVSERLLAIGSTRLANLATDRVLPWMIVLALAALICAVCVLAVNHRRSAQLQRARFGTLRALGYRLSALRSLRLQATLLTSIFLATVLACCWLALLAFGLPLQAASWTCLSTFVFLVLLRLIVERSS